MIALSRLPPIKERALLCLAHGPITGAWNAAWSGYDGSEFNTHSVAWAVSSGLANFNRGRTEARITQDGREMAKHLEGRE